MKKYQIIYADPPWDFGGGGVYQDGGRNVRKTSIELFARQKTEGWDVWGNEVESDIKFGLEV